MSHGIVRLGIVGGNRGSHFDAAMEHLRGRLALTAVCDRNPSVLAQWRQRHANVAAFTSFEQMLAADICDAVFIATPMELHAGQSLAALRAGKHVLSEVTACTTHEEAVALVNAVEKTGLTYMMAENYIYMRPHMMVREMVRQGVFGELTYAEGMYVHDCRPLMFNPDGSLTWRGELARDMSDCSYYPTHSLGPIAKWMDIGRSDQLSTVFCMASPSHAMVDYTSRRFGAASAGAGEGYWRRGDSANCLIKTVMGRLISLRVDVASHRPHHMTVHELQGTRACYRTQTRPEDEPLIWIDGKSPSVEYAPGFASAEKWESLFKYANEFDEPRWKRYGDQALQAGHGGGDFFILEDFVSAIHDAQSNPVDIYDAVTWSSVLWLSAESARLGRAVNAIDYRNGAAIFDAAPQLVGAS